MLQRLVDALPEQCAQRWIRRSGCDGSAQQRGSAAIAPSGRPAAGGSPRTKNGFAGAASAFVAARNVIDCGFAAAGLGRMVRARRDA